eukprot:6571288-Karenia_brevis.AAC.1
MAKSKTEASDTGKRNVEEKEFDAVEKEKVCATGEDKGEATGELKYGKAGTKDTGEANLLDTQNKAKTLKKFGTNMFKKIAIIM